MNHLLFVETWFPAPLAKAIGWTLVHSLWQGLLLTFLAGILITFTRRSAASIRYKLLSSLLILFVICAAITFIIEWQSALATAQLITTTVADPIHLTITGSFPGDLPGLDKETADTTGFTLFDIIANYINQYSPLIVATWFFIFLFKCIRLTVHIGYAQHLKNYKTSPLPDLQHRLEELAKMIRVNTSVVVRESGIVKVPSVIGFLKPVILLPVGLLSNLPADQVEAILLHELAHIRRKDYLVNILQCLAETVFFFNPSVLWLSSLIRQERENCCDDMAISIIGKKATYVSALVAFQEYSSDSPYAPAFPGEKYPVLQRVKRIVYNNNKNLNNMEKIFLAGGVALSALLVLTFSTTSAQQSPKASIPATDSREPVKRTTADDAANPSNAVLSKITAAPRDTVPSFTGTITTHEDGKAYTIVVKDNIVKGLFIDNEAVPVDKFADYKALTDRLIQDHHKRSEAKAAKERMKYDNNLARIERDKQKLYVENEKARYKAEKDLKNKEKEFEFKDDKDFQYQGKMDLKNQKDFELKNKKEFDLKNKKEFDLKNDKDNKLFKTKDDTKYKTELDREREQEKINERKQKENERRERDNKRNQQENEKNQRLNRQGKVDDKTMRDLEAKLIRNDKEYNDAVKRAEQRAEENRKNLDEMKRKFEENRKTEIKNLEREMDQNEKNKQKEIKLIKERYKEYQEKTKNKNKEESVLIEVRKDDDGESRKKPGNPIENAVERSIEKSSNRKLAVKPNGEPKPDKRLAIQPKTASIAVLDIKEQSSRTRQVQTSEPRVAINTSESESSSLSLHSNDNTKLLLASADGHDRAKVLRSLILAELRDQQLIPNQRFVQLELNDFEMRLNGRKQANKVHDDFKRKFLKTNSDRINLTYENISIQQ